MSKEENGDIDGLRNRAEALLSKVHEQPHQLTLEEVKAIVHDLRVHQIELELQNEELRNTQQALQKMSNQYARLYDRAPVGYLTVDQNGFILQANNTFGEMVKTPAHKLFKTSLFDLIAGPEDKQEFISRFRAFYKNPDDKFMEIRLKRGRSAAFHASLEGRIDRAVLTEGDEEAKLLLIVNDVSSKKKADLELQRQRHVLQTILDGIPDVISLQKADHTIISYNRAGYEYLGLPPGEADGRKCFELIGREGPCEFCATELARTAGGPETIEKFIPELDKWFQVSAIPVYDNGGRVTMLVEQMHDIDDRKKAELALIENEKKYRSLVENSLQGVVAATADPVRVKFASRQMRDITGYTPEELTSFSPDQLSGLVHPEDREVFFNNFKNRLAGRDVPPRREYRILHKTNGVRWVEIYSTLIEYENGPAVQTAFLDITERKRAEEQHRLLQEQLQHAQKMEAIGTLAGGIAHDFNNLLQAISGYAQIILMDREEDEVDQHSLNAILKACERAAVLVRQMLLFSRKVEADRKPIDISKDIEEARRILERTIPKMIRIEVHCPEGLWPVLADPVQFEQVLLNLGGNAADAMPDGGRMIIESRNVVIGEDYAEDLFGAPPGQYVLVTVSDTGCGMDKKTLEHIFEPFFTTKEVGKGTGLGLASVYGIVKSHGGFINCYSEEGAGSVFKIYLPAFVQEQANVEKGPPTDRLVGGAETILLVDDESAVRDFAGRLLRKYGYRVLAAESGEEALRIFRERAADIDLVVLDISMPGMGGHKCLKELLQNDPAVKVIVSSGYSINGPVKDTLKAGAAAFVGKPYQAVDLLSNIREVLEGGGRD